MESAPSAVESAGSDVNVEEEISYSSLQLKNPNAEDRRRIRQYLMQKRLREGKKKKETPTCKACMRLGHSEYKCPYRRAVKEGTPLGPGWKIVCSTCLGEDCLPGDKNVLRCAVEIYCAKCSVALNHPTRDCPDLTPAERKNFERNAKRKSIMCEELASMRRARQSLANLSLESQ